VRDVFSMGLQLPGTLPLPPLHFLLTCVVDCCSALFHVRAYSKTFSPSQLGFLKEVCFAFVEFRAILADSSVVGPNSIFVFFGILGGVGCFVSIRTPRGDFHFIIGSLLIHSPFPLQSRSVYRVSAVPVLFLV